MPKEKTLPPKLLEVLKKIDMTQEQATWDVHGTPVLLHKACEKMAAEYNIVFDAPTMIESDVLLDIWETILNGLLVRLHPTTIKTIILTQWQKNVPKTG